ncbi:EndoU domain-containing protein [Planktothrix sp. FACHB-1365]|uniref:EndoU domain-containing protein n=1 Tax=Planktothrix sp. FACHB-1365 TaxID=2692855 RepID=UPI00168611E0|nr:EndoU domain-containing protein [Planktothrix sp. FACHB-1365]MBD2481621.1 EndoU domain-containing protein [Planktothrix sp. FACHB-1365]
MLRLLSVISRLHLPKTLYLLLSLTLLTTFRLLNVVPNPAWAATPYQGTFTLTKACDATLSISGNSPTPLTIDSTYEVVSLNQDTNPTHVYIKIPNLGTRWVALSCGKLEGLIQVRDSNSSPLLPFFDTVNNPVTVADGSQQDLTPVPPRLNEFDQAVNKICGLPGTVVSPADFKVMMKQFPGVLANIKKNVGGFMIAGRISDAEFLEDFTDAWFVVKGFDHVFCGEPDSQKIGGLHYVGRYLDLQNKKLAGRLPNSDYKAEVLPGAVYSMGVLMKVGNQFVQSLFKGYAYTLNAEETLTLAAKTFKNNFINDPKPTACLVKITDDGKTFTNVFVSKNGGIRTFYSDATPDYKKEPACKG